MLYIATLTRVPWTGHGPVLMHQLTGSAMATAAPTCKEIPDQNQENASMHKPNTAPAAVSNQISC